MQLTNSSGTVTKNYRYDAFGVEIGKAENDTNPWRYCGEYWDDETGTYYLRARSYDPRTGRFLSEDPIRSGLNWYTYCSGNPVGFVDPSGLVDVLLDYIVDKNEGEFTYKIVTRVKRFSRSKVIIVTHSDGRMACYGYEEIGGMTIIDSDWLVRDFGLDREKVEHQAMTDKFKSTDHAALAWSLKYGELTNKNKTEYASWIYKSERNFIFGEPVIGTDKNVKAPAVLEGYTRAAFIHSHPLYWNYFFSENKIFSDMDKARMHENYNSFGGRPFTYYMCTSGKLYHSAAVYKMEYTGRGSKQKTLYSGFSF